ncbi:MAG: S-layer homology domain-containing protein, partial [Chloroflexia bacterium]
YVDAPPWMGGTPGPMEPADGSFDSPTEGVRATVATATLTTGRHLLMVRGRGVKSYEGYESWGPFTARFLDVLPPGSGTPTPGPATTPTITSTATPSPCGASFSDVHPADYFYEPISYLYCRGAISGYGDGTFRPYNNTTRGQLCKIVVLAEGWSLYAPSSATFLDVPLDHPFYAYIETAHAHGAISGYADGTFRPGNEVTRGQLCKIIVLAQGRSLVGEGQHFMDVLPGNPFFAYVETAFDRDIITGYADHTFRWGSHATRGQAGSVLYRARTP